LEACFAEEDTVCPPLTENIPLARRFFRPARSHTFPVNPSDSLAQKIARNPFRFGLIVGFLGVPLLWMAGVDVLRLVFKEGILPAEAFWSYEASGALVGAILGGQGASIWGHWRAGHIREARATALLTGLVGAGVYVFVAGVNAATSPFWARDFAVNLLSLLLPPHLPFLLCLLLLFGGLFAPRK